MAVLVNKSSKIIVQGFTGGEGTFHATQMIAYGSNVVGGVTPGKGGTLHLNKPVFNSVADAVKQTKANVSIIFVPAAFAADAIMEAADAGIEVIVCITEGIPVKDMIKAKHYLKDKSCRLIGPNCPGVITAGECKVGIMPGFVFKKGKIGIVSKSGTLTYEAADQIAKAGLGVSTAIGIGGDPIIGTPTRDAVELLMNDPKTDAIVMIGEIGGNYEADAARWIKSNGNRKPVVGFIAGQTAPKGRTMGHAGAIVGGAEDTAQAKMQIMRKCGIVVCESPAEIGMTMAKLLSKKINTKPSKAKASKSQPKSKTRSAQTKNVKRKAVNKNRGSQKLKTNSKPKAKILKSKTRSFKNKSLKSKPASRKLSGKAKLRKAK